MANILNIEDRVAPTTLSIRNTNSDFDIQTWDDFLTDYVYPSHIVAGIFEVLNDLSVGSWSKTGADGSYAFIGEQIIRSGDFPDKKIGKIVSDLQKYTREGEDLVTVEIESVGPSNSSALIVTIHYSSSSAVDEYDNRKLESGLYVCWSDASHSKRMFTDEDIDHITTHRFIGRNARRTNIAFRKSSDIFPLEASQDDFKEFIKDCPTEVHISHTSDNHNSENIVTLTYGELFEYTNMTAEGAARAFVNGGPLILRPLSLGESSQCVIADTVDMPDSIYDETFQKIRVMYSNYVTLNYDGFVILKDIIEGLVDAFKGLDVQDRTISPTTFLFCKPFYTREGIANLEASFDRDGSAALNINSSRCTEVRVDVRNYDPDYFNTILAIMESLSKHSDNYDLDYDLISTYVTRKFISSPLMYYRGTFDKRFIEKPIVEGMATLPCFPM